MNNILVTGASGLLGSHVVKHLLAKECHVIVSILPEEKSTYQPLDGVEVIINDDIFQGKFPHISTVINCAFSRSNQSQDLASAIDFTQKLINGFKLGKVDSIINISSQGVYKRLPIGELSKEDSPIEPIDLYSMAKYAVEKTFETSGLPNVTNVRLASLNMKQRFLYHFVQKAKNNEIITVNSPNHYASILDVDDAAEALARLALISSNNRKPIYNLGTGNQTSLMELAELVNVVGERYNAKAQIVLQDNGTTNTAGVDISLISNDCNWTPIITNEKMIENFFLFD
jgi:nucleoside-diphosphate-sugar epimerase